MGYENRKNCEKKIQKINTISSLTRQKENTIQNINIITDFQCHKVIDILQQHFNCERFDLSRGLFKLCQLNYSTKINVQYTFMCNII